MKLTKFLSLLIALFSLNGCSETSEKSEITPLARTVEAQVFYDYLNSQSFRAYDAEVINFIDLLKVDEAELQTRADFTIWIQNNLSLTNFSSTAQAVSLYERLEYLYADTFRQNPRFVARIADGSSDLRFFIDALNEYHDIPIIAYNPCTDICFNTYWDEANDCNSGAAAGVGVSALLYVLSPPSGFIQAGYTWISSRICLRTARRNLYRCYDACVASGA